MYHLATAFPVVRHLPRLPLTRDQIMLLMIAINELFLGLDTYLSHNIGGTIRGEAWIPIIFGVVAGAVLLVAGLIAVRQRMLASMIATITFLLSIGVGILGAYLHLLRGTLPDAPAGQGVSLDLLIWAPPILAPLYFALVGILGISAAWIEMPPDSGLLQVSNKLQLLLPYSKTHAYFYMVSMGILAALISSVLDHARSNFADPWIMVPIGVGTFALLVTVMLGAIEKPHRFDLLTYIVAMLALMVVGVIGMVLHVQENLTPSGLIVAERFVRGAPFMAPLLFSNMGMLGLLVLLDPVEHRPSSTQQSTP